jgi:hypothetical protein
MNTDQPIHVHSRQCWEDPGAGHGRPFLICDKLDAKQLAECREMGRVLTKAELVKMLADVPDDCGINFSHDTQDDITPAVAGKFVLIGDAYIFILYAVQAAS